MTESRNPALLDQESNKDTFEALKREAEELRSKQDTEWAHEHLEVWRAFEDKLIQANDAGQINDREYDDLYCTAFYDCEYSLCSVED